jgi:phosphatidylinositol-bisphosphatase
VNSKPLPQGYDLSEWLLRRDCPPADIYVVSLQEMVDLNVMNVVINAGTSDEMAVSWIEKIFSLLRTTGIEYKFVMEKHLVGLACIVFSRASLFNTLSDVRFSVVYTGGYGVTGNKGGIAIRFDCLDSSLCFVCAHFHANRDNVETRNSDFQNITDSAVFPPPGSSAAKRSSVVIGESMEKSSRPYSLSNKEKNKSISLNILQHEHIFWLGDLNYRIALELDELEVFDIVQSGGWLSLRAKDQLNIERDKGNVFQNFEEGQLKFPPTYKYQPGTDLYEQREGKKLRAPAWCDRILWRTMNKESVKLSLYATAPMNISDHKPVMAWFDCGVRKVVPAKAHAVYQDLLFAVDKWVNASTPKLAVTNRIIDFGTVSMDVRHLNIVVLYCCLN